MEDSIEVQSSGLSTSMCSYEDLPNHELDNLKQDHELVVAMVPFPAQGLNQLLQLACLISSSDLPVYYVGSATLIRQAQDVSSFPNAESYIFNCGSAFNMYCFSFLFRGMSMQLEEEFLKKLPSLEGVVPNEVGDFIAIQVPYMDIRSDREVMELMMGLEQSKQKFIWMLREANRGDIFTVEARKLELPEGYDEKSGFMSHCGWNSCIESITMGVPIAGWPMPSDQPMNSFLVTGILKIGLTVREWEKREELVSASTIENVVRKLKASEEGDVIRKRAEELGVAVRRSTEKGGGSLIELDSFIAHITR
ncbi:putative L-gulonolactone oxidase-like [Capsicum annuum]|nr:putative L-gulonolactone oxidase-like [Capsicum annuum]